MKNVDVFKFGPKLAVARRPFLLNFLFRFISSLKYLSLGFLSPKIDVVKRWELFPDEGSPERAMWFFYTSKNMQLLKYLILLSLMKFSQARGASSQKRSITNSPIEVSRNTDIFFNNKYYNSNCNFC